MRTWQTLATMALIIFLTGVQGADETPKAAAPGTLVVVDSAGKEHTLKSWKITAGTRRLTWLAPAAPVKEDKPKEKEAKPPAGPEALEFREDKTSTNLPEGILRLIPLERIRALEYDSDKQTVTVRVALGDKMDEAYTGTTKFKGENKIAIEAEIDKGDMGVAEIKFLGGVPKGIRGVRFPAPKSEAASTGRAAQLHAVDKSVHKISDLQALYRQGDGSARLSSLLMFKKTLKIDLAKVKKIRVHAGNAKEGPECDVTLKDGEESTLTLLRTIPLDDKPAVLEGLLGRTTAGYKLFPIRTLAEIQFED